MLRRAFLILMGGSVATATWDAIAAVPQLPFKVIDAMPTFWEFWDTTVDESMSMRVSGFFNKVVAAYPDLFHHDLIASGALTDLDGVPEVQARVAKYLQDVSSFIPAMRQITTTIRNNFFRYVQEFSTAFPDYAPSTPVYFSVSLFGFSGGLLVSEENTGLYFGLDELARIYGSAGNLKIIIQHELFHHYHYQIAPEISVDRAAWAFIWEEGLATYVSRRMNPGTTADQVLVTPDRLSELAQPHLPDLARRLLDHADSTNPNDYDDLFSGEQTPSGIPARSGYFVGYRVAEKLAATRSLVDLVHLRGPELKVAVLGVLAELQRPE
jgi:Putative zinc dependent peptidase (DUF5700)